ncbi:hypothetical protein BDW_03760 [Bdellovibrio bacteriovorus W]|nr:hypothetical protein BDW_03760 [Bdellovibrio bacteriovorus W]
MSLAQATKKLKFDTRLLESNVTKGELSKEELKKHIEALPDVSGNSETFKLDGKHTQEDSH